MQSGRKHTSTHPTRRGPQFLRGRPVRRGLLAVAATGAVLLGMPILAKATPATDSNPDLPSTCGLDVSLVLDDSASLDGNEANLARTAADTFATALVGTPSRLKVVTFDSRATGVQAAGTSTSNLNNIVFRNPSLYTAPTSGAGQGGTNWDDGLEVVRRSNGGPGKLVVFITDGDPTYRNQDEPDGHANDGSHDLDGDGSTIGDANNLSAAVAEANAIKTAGAHMFGIGVGLTAAASEQRLNDVTGDEELTLDVNGIPNIPFGEADYTIAPNFGQLLPVIKAFVRDLCAPSVNVTKFLQKADGTTVKANAATPWQFTATVSPTPLSWSDPAGASGATAAQSTDANGGASFAWEPNDANNFVVDLTEVQQFGWVYNGSKCVRNPLDGTDPVVIFDNVGTNAPGQSKDMAELQDLTLNLNQAVSCEVYNRQIRPTTIQVSKQTVPAGRPETFDFSLKNDNGTLDTVADLAHGQTGTFDPVGAGTYEVVEDPVPGFTLQSATCDNLGTTGTTETVDPSDLVVTEGENWKCTFVNAADPGSITVVKHTQGGGADGTFSFTSDVPTLGNFDLTTNGGTATTAKIAVPVGTYSVSENGLSPWTLQGSSCTPQQAPGQVTVGPGEDIVCTFTNVAPDPSIQIDKTALTPTVGEPGGAANYSLTVTNTWVDDLLISTLTDSVEGGAPVDVTTIPGNTCAPLIGQILTPTGPGSTATCTFSLPVTGDSGDIIDDEAAVKAYAPNESQVTDSDTAQVTISDVLPSLTVSKTPSVGSITEPGGPITYSVLVTNTSAEAVTLDSLTDSIEGGPEFDVTTVAPPVTATTCATGGTIAADGGTYSCQFTVNQVVDDSASGDGDVDDTVKATVSDDEQNAQSAAAAAAVTIIDAVPTITVSKTPSPSTVAETGPGQTRTATYTVGIQNTGVEDVTIDSVLDSVEGGPNGAVGGTCAALLGTTLAAQTGTTCTFTAEVSGNAGDIADDTVTVNASDDEGNPASNTASASVTFTGVDSSLSVTKTAAPASVPEPGATVTYTVGITNTSPSDTITLGAITDVVGAGAPVAAGGTCPALVGTTLAPGASTSCQFTLPVTGDAGDTIGDTVTVTGTDDDGGPVSDSADESVAVTDVPGSISVTKSPSVSSVPEPGGPVTYTVLIENTSPADAVTLDSITDVVEAGAPAAAGGTCPALIGTTIPVGGNTTCAFTMTVSGNNGDSVLDTVTVAGTDDDDEPVDGSDSAVVDITDSAAILSVTKTPSTDTVPEPGGPVTYTVVVTNGSVADTVTIDSITDKVGEEGEPFPAEGTCDDLVGTEVAPGATTTCQFTLTVSGDDGDIVPDTVTVMATDDDPIITFAPSAKVAPAALKPTATTLTASASAVVSVAGVPPTGTVTKDADPSTVPEPGGPVDFDVEITNTSIEDVTVTSITDTVNGSPVDVTAVGGDVTATNCATGAVLAPSGTYTCTFTLQVTGNAGDTVTDVISTLLTDNDGETVTPADTEVVTVTDVMPSITVVKDNGGAVLPAPGGDVEFDVTVTNTSVEPVTLTSLTDSIGGGSPFDITTVADPVTATTCAVGGSIAVGASYSCSFTVAVTSAEAAQEVDTVDATATDDEGNPATAGDDAVTAITASADVSIDKTVDGDLQPGQSGTYGLAVGNAGPSMAVGVEVIDTLPDGLTATSAGGDGWACDISGQTVTCSRPSLDAGASSAITVEVDVDVSLAGQDVTNVAEVGSTTADPDPTNNRDQVTSVVPETEPEEIDNPEAPVQPGAPPVVPGTLARTGSDLERVVLLGFGLVAAGCGVLVTRRYRSRWLVSGGPR